MVAIPIGEESWGAERSSDPADERAGNCEKGGPGARHGAFRAAIAGGAIVVGARRESIQSRHSSVRASALSHRVEWGHKEQWREVDAVGPIPPSENPRWLGRMSPTVALQSPSGPHVSPEARDSSRERRKLGH